MCPSGLATHSELCYPFACGPCEELNLRGPCPDQITLNTAAPPSLCSFFLAERLACFWLSL